MQVESQRKQGLTGLRWPGLTWESEPLGMWPAVRSDSSSWEVQDEGPRGSQQRAPWGLGPARVQHGWKENSGERRTVWPGMALSLFPSESLIFPFMTSYELCIDHSSVMTPPGLSSF